jgi:putative transposase
MHLPHLWPFEKAPIVFLTTCTHSRCAALASASAHEVLRDVWQHSAEFQGWFVGQYVIMPDHVHLFAWPDRRADPLAGWMRMWQSISASRINRSLGGSGTLWQADYFDRYLRSREDYTQKWDYVAQNPVRKGIATNPHEWPYRGVIHEIEYRSPRD